MFHLVFVLLSVSLLAMAWVLVRTCHPMVARILPKTLTFTIGALLALIGAFGGFLDAYYLRDPEGVFSCFVMIVVGTWFMLAPTSNLRGTYRDEQLMKRIFFMLALVFLVTTVAMYLPQHKAIALVNLLMMTGGLYSTTSYLRQVDSGN